MNIQLKHQKGIAAIELTLVLPFLLMMIFATAEFGRMIYQYNALNHLTRDALRYAIHDVFEGDTVVSANAVSAIKAETTNLLFYGKYTATPPNVEVLPNLSGSDVMLEKTGDHYVTITVTYYWQPLFLTTLNKISSSFPLVVNYTMRAI